MVYGHIVENEMQDIEAVQCMRMIGFNITFLVYALSMKREGTNSTRSMMKQDLEGEKLFRQIVDETPAELKTQLRFSDSIAEKIDGILKERGMSQRELAKKTNKTEAEVSRWLGGTHNFTLRTLAKISLVLGEDLIRV